MSRSARAFHKGTLPMITVSITRNWSNANWSWRSTPNFFGRVMDPLVGSISPVKIFISVDLPAPLGPVTAYRRPGRNVQVTSSNRVLAPKRMEMLLTESKATYHYSARAKTAKVVGQTLSSVNSSRPCPTIGGAWFPALFPRLHAGAIVRLQIAERVLHARQHVLQHRPDGVDRFAVAVGFVEDPPLALAADPAQTVVVVGAWIFFFRLIGIAHLVVVDTGQDVQVGARPCVHAVRIGLVVNVEFL